MAAAKKKLKTNAEKKKKKWYAQSFREEWLDDPEFSGWLQPDYNDKTSSYCTCCKARLKHTNRSMLISHKNTKKHKRFFFGMPKSNLQLKKRLSETESSARAQLLLACFFTEHRIHFRHIDHFIEVVKNAFHDCKTTRKVDIRKSKLASLVQDGIAYHEKEEIAEICRNQKFSIMIDENIDVSPNSFIATVVRFFDKEKLDVVDVLFDTISLENGTNEDVYNAIKMLFEDKNIPLENIIGFGSDNCLKGVFSLLKEDVPTVFGLGCDCHSLFVCLNQAIKMLPVYIEVFLRDIASYFVSHLDQLKEFGVDVDFIFAGQNKAYDDSSTPSYLSYENIINAVLNQWHVLTQYFVTDSKIDEVDISQQIYATIVSRGTKHMLLFLQYILLKVNAFTSELQAEEFSIHLLHSLIAQTYRDILSCFIDDEVIFKSKLSEIDPLDISNHKSLDDIFLGGKTMALLYQEPLNEDTEQFKTSCLQFLVEFANHMKQNFPIPEDSVVAYLKILDPAVARDPQQSPEFIINLAIHFPMLVPKSKLHDLEKQWKEFKESKEYPYNASSMSQYWYLLGNVKEHDGSTKFDLLSEFMTSLSALPHLSTAVEAIFSEINLIKMNYSNPLKAEAVKDQLIARQMLGRKNLTCCTWEPSKTLIKDVVTGECLRRTEMRMELFKAICGVDETLEMEDADSD